jgi:hypothetical protein
MALLKTVNYIPENSDPLFAERREGMICALAFSFENDLEQSPEIARGPTLQLEPAQILGG